MEEEAEVGRVVVEDLRRHALGEVAGIGLDAAAVQCGFDVAQAEEVEQRERSLGYRVARTRASEVVGEQDELVLEVRFHEVARVALVERGLRPAGGPQHLERGERPPQQRLRRIGSRLSGHAEQGDPATLERGEQLSFERRLHHDRLVVDDENGRSPERRCEHHVKRLRGARRQTDEMERSPGNRRIISVCEEHEYLLRRATGRLLTSPGRALVNQLHRTSKFPALSRCELPRTSESRVRAG